MVHLTFSPRKALGTSFSGHYLVVRGEVLVGEQVPVLDGQIHIGRRGACSL